MQRPSGTITAALLLLLVAALAWRSVTDIDFGIHVASGRWISEHGRVPDRDPFSFTQGDRPYLAYHWLVQLGLYQTWSRFGERGVGAARWLLLMATALLVAAVFRLRRSSPPAIALVGALAILAAEPRFRLRPELASYLLAAGTLLVLERHRCGRRAPLWLLPVFQVVWVNSHVYAFGWAILLAYLGEELLRTRRLRSPLAAWVAACGPALLANPYGLAAVLHPLHLAELAGSAELGRRVSELASPLAPLARGEGGGLPAFLLAYLALLILGAAALAVHLRRGRWADAALIAVFGGLSTLALRNVALYAVVCAPAIAAGVDPWPPVAAPARAGGAPRAAARLALLAVLAGVALAAVRVAGDSYYRVQGRPERFGAGLCHTCLGTDAADWLAARELAGRGFNNFNFGGTLMWRDPAHPVFVDGRLEVPDEAFLRRYAKMMQDPRAWESARGEYGFEYAAIAHRDSDLHLVARLAADPGWRLVYADGAAVVFVRGAGPNAGVPRAEIPTALGEGERWRALRAVRVTGGAGARLLRWLWWSEPSVEEDYLRGAFWLRVGRPEAAEASLLRAALRSPGSAHVHAALAALYQRLGRWRAMALALRNLERLDPDHPHLALLDEVERRAAPP